MAVLSDSVRVVALEVLVQARSVLLEVRVDHGECVELSQSGRGQLETVHRPFFIPLSASRIQTHVADLGDSQDQPFRGQSER